MYIYKDVNNFVTYDRFLFIQNVAYYVNTLNYFRVLIVFVVHLLLFNKNLSQNKNDSNMEVEKLNLRVMKCTY